MSLLTQAQTPGRFTIKGTVIDSSGTLLPSATVMLLTPQDSALVNFGRTNEQGELEFKNVKRASYLLKISYVGYLPYEQQVQPGEEAVVDLGQIQLKMLNQDLFEVVIKAARAPLSIRGDTVEYNAGSFKVPPGSTVEDLLRRLPGMQIEQDGTIRSQGQEVKRVTVDGKRFFGDDPKMATKNLPAEAISKVQVFNGKSEQARITGVEDGKQEKTLNLELKDSHKKGGFGKATVGAGTDNRVEGKVNYNRFNDKQQFAIVGFGNNTNQSGLSWDDYQDFRGSQSFNWGDDGDFGFSSGGGVRFVSFDDDQESLTIQAGRSSRDRGFTKNWAGGANYNYDTKKTKFSSNYFYNQTDQTLDVLSNRENFLSSGTFQTSDNNTRSNLNMNHRGGIRFEHTLDSLNTIIVISNARFGRGSSRYNSLQEFYRGENNLSTRSNINNNNRFNSFSMGNTAIFRHKFQKKGRNFAVSVGYNINNSDGDATQRSVNEFFREEGDSTAVINQDNQTVSLRTQFKASALYIEPLGKKFFWETFANFSLRQDEVDRDVFDISQEAQIRNTFLSRYYTNDFVYNRFGSSMRYSYKGFNLSAGLARVYFDLKGQFSQDQTTPEIGRVDRQFTRWTPSASLNYSMKNNKYLFMNYNLNVDEPPIRDLQPIIDNSNPLYIREGNPDLQPQANHNVSAGLSMFNPGNFTQFFINVYYAYYLNQIVYNQTVSQDLITTTRPVNISGGTNLGSYINYGFPLVKTKSTLNINSSIGFNKNLIYVNEILNTTNTDRYNVGLRLDLTPSDKFTLYTNANWNFSNTRYSLNTTQNQKIVNSSYGAEMNVKLPAEMYFSSRFNLNTFVNDRFGFNQTQPILNLSVYKIILKDKKGEVRLSAYDLFNQNRGITQYATQNFVSTEQVNTLARYFMLSFTYNMRGVTGGVRRRGF
ncbi:TonB-dependent receptor [Arundinibacter roseus]|uniref:TonB-dependent receptor n=2 Tax=Arundinibacter roseus TaxID=2070510 RepID=A0A4R4KA39_9BACT|nr:TonB-dependent receptor [Arundinibacter roseus]